MSKTSIFLEYLEIHNNSINKYGIQTVVFMEVGSFFEIYAVINDDENIGADIYEICNLFNIQVTKKNKSIENVTRSNYLMAGFPNHSSQKFIDIMVNNNYTVVIVEQVTPPPKSIRSVTKVISPSTYVNVIQKYESNIMMCFYMEKVKSFKTKIEYHVLGWSSFDASTGISNCTEVTCFTDDKLLVDEIYRIILSYNPREVVFISVEDKDNTFDGTKFISTLDLTNCCIHNKIHQMSKKYTQIKYQNEVLNKVFTNHGMLSVIEYIDLEFKPYALISFVYMIQFIFEHGEQLLLKLKKPVVICKENDNTMIIANNALSQLNIIGKDYNLLQCLNTCKTSVGKRFFKRTLLNPIVNTDELNRRYSTIACFLSNLKSLKKIALNLSNVIDIERMFRKIACNQIQPCELHCLVNSIIHVNDIFVNIYKIKDISDNVTDLQEYVTKHRYDFFIKHINDNLDIDLLSKYNIDNINENIFQKGVYKDIDELIHHRCLIHDNLNNLVNFVDKKTEMTNWLKKEKNDRDGFHFLITNKRWKSLQDYLAKQELCDEIKHLNAMTVLSQNGSNIRLSSEYIKSMNNDIQNYNDKIKKLLVVNFRAFVNDIHDVYGKVWFDSIVKILEKVDFFLACARNAESQCLTKPTIVNDNNDDISSFVELECVRHLIIENVQKDIEYTPNSIMLGSRSAIKNKGVVLFGVNASGKSSFMKSVGLAIIQAQAGMYVPCKKMNYKPYNHIFTRIQSSDNILKGLSTFSNEISELRNIFKCITCNSLVIGDELCAGTESISALSIVTAGIETLVNMNTSFIFATHLHELNELARVNKMLKSSDIAIKHLSVEYDELNGCLVYDRSIKDGPGSSLYGLEVCKAMNMNPTFIHLANTIRHELLSHTDSHEIVRHKLSRYNNTVVIDSCGICHDSNNDLETHHIKFQKDAKDNGFIDNRYHKNSKFNLVPLCQSCHNKVHNNTLNIHGWKQTTNGIKLHYEIYSKDSF